MPILFAKFLFIALFPIFAFFLVNLGAIAIATEELKDDQLITRVYLFLFVSGILSTLFALTLNTTTSSIVLVFSLFLNKSEENLKVILLIFFAVVAPLVEEMAKGVPLFILARSMRKEWGENERRLFKTSKLILISAILVGSIFTFLETYLYVFNSVDLSSQSLQEGFGDAFAQIMIRWTFPLHIATTILMGWGVYNTNMSSRNKVPMPKEFLPMGLTFFGAVALHGAWNGSLVMARFTDTLTLPVYGLDFPITTFGVGIVVIAIIAGSGYIFWRMEDRVCPVCQNVHSEPFDLDSHYDIEFAVPGRFNFQIQPKKSMAKEFLAEIRRNMKRKKRPEIQARRQYVLEKKYDKALEIIAPQCIICNASLPPSGICNSCRATPLFACTNCNFPVPVYSQYCWKCKKEITPPYSTVLSALPSFLDMLSMGIMILFVVNFIVITIYMSFALLSLGFTTALITRLFLYIMIAVSMVIVVQWYLSRDKRGLAVAYNRILFALVTVDTGLMAIFFYGLALFTATNFMGDPASLLVGFLLTIMVELVAFYIAFVTLRDVRIMIQQTQEVS